MGLSSPSPAYSTFAWQLHPKVESSIPTISCIYRTKIFNRSNKQFSLFYVKDLIVLIIKQYNRKFYNIYQYYFFLLSCRVDCIVTTTYSSFARYEVWILFSIDLFMQIVFYKYVMIISTTDLTKFQIIIQKGGSFYGIWQLRLMKTIQL